MKFSSGTKYISNFLIVVFVHILLSYPLLAQSNEALRLESADILRKQETPDGRSINKLEGNVHFRKGEYDLYCTDALWYKAEQFAKFWGNVRVFGTQDTLYSDSLFAYDDGDLLIATGDAHLLSGTRTLTAHTIRYFPETKQAEAVRAVEIMGEGRIVHADSVWYQTENKVAELYGTGENMAAVFDSARQVRIEAPKITQNLDTESLKATLRPVLTKLDSNQNTVVQIVSNTVTGNPDSGRYVALEDVIITRDSMRAETNFATLYEEENYAVLENNPVVYYNENTIRGKTIHLYFQNEVLNQVYIPQDADVLSLTRGFMKRPLSAYTDTSLSPPVDTVSVESRLYGLEPIENENLLKGKELRIWLEENSIDSILVSGMAQSTYHVFEDSIYQGINETSGDTISMQFDAETDSLRRIEVIGGTRGNFKPNVSNTSVDTTVFYEAQKLIFQVPKRITNLEYESNAKYMDMELDAAFINVFWEKDLLVATPLPDSATSDSINHERNIPTFTQTGKEPMTGQRLEYNLQTRRGRVTYGKTKDEEGYYTGEDIFQRGENTLYVESGVYTTCDLEDPHFHFESRRMKLLVGDKVIAKPIVMYIHDVPVFGLPFGLFPQKTGGRTSGYIMPTWGESASSGRYLRGLGYYFAPSEYWDYRVLFDFWENRGVSFRQRFRYNKRYAYRGDIQVDYDKEFFRPEKTQNYRINISHNQTIDPTLDLRVNGSFVSSSSFIRETQINRQDRLRQQIISNATLSKRWENSKNSMSLNLGRTENLQTGNIDQTLPQVSFRRGTDNLFKPPEGASFQVKNRWYYNINYSYGANLTNKLDRKLVEDSIYIDPYQIRKELDEDSTYVYEHRQNVRHSLSFQAPIRVFKFFNFNPSLSITENWVPAYREPVIRNGVVALDTLRADTLDTGEVTHDTRPRFRVVDQFRARHTFRFSFGTTTKLYGLFPISIGPLQAVRHVMTPQVNYNIGPDFSKRGYGYYFYGTMPDGTVEKFDRFTGTLAGRTGSRETQSLSISLRNVFQAKYLTSSNGETEENQIDFLTWNINTNYNFTNPERKWSNIRSSIRMSLGRRVGVEINMTHDPYKYQSNELTMPRLTDISFRTGFNMSGKSFVVPKPDTDTSTETEIDTDTTLIDTTDANFPDDSMNRDRSLFPNMPGSSTTRQSLWNLRMSLNYSVRKNNPNIEPEPTFWLNTNADLRLTQKWSVSVNSRFDMANREMVSTDFSINRDLHCWELSFTWTPTGYARGYYLRINVKSPSLQDVKIESRGGRQNRFGYY